LTGSRRYYELRPGGLHEKHTAATGNHLSVWPVTGLPDALLLLAGGPANSIIMRYCFATVSVFFFVSFIMKFCDEGSIETDARKRENNTHNN
jgi:hypothetical protein